MRSRRGEAHRRRADAAGRSSFRRTQGPLAHPVRPSSYIEINNFYTATVYEKGAEVCRMMQHADRAATPSAKAWTCISPAMTARR